MTNTTKLADDFRKIYDDIFKSEYIPDNIYDALSYEIKDQMLREEVLINSAYYRANGFFQYWNNIFDKLNHLDHELKDMDHETYQFLISKLNEYKKERYGNMIGLKYAFKSHCNHVRKYTNQNIIDEL